MHGIQYNIHNLSFLITIKKKNTVSGSTVENAVANFTPIIQIIEECILYIITYKTY